MPMVDEETLDFARLMFNMRKRTLEREPHIKEYTRARKIHSEIVNAMADYHESGKFELKFDVEYAAEQRKSHGMGDSKVLRLLETEFDMESNTSIQAFFDMNLYKSAPNANCITEEFIAKNRYRKPEKVEMLNSMLNSVLGLFEVIKTDSKEGYAYVKEVFTGKEFKMTDIGLSGDEDCKILVYTRIITYRGISFSSGLNLLFSKSDPFIVSFIKRNKKDYLPFGEFARFTELYNRYSNASDSVMALKNTYS
ncbi:MAG: hypothetical protein FWG45_00950 [Oscillospiraceae bacterium]|nr:hypothetical protein [Oscillospiraceae bacterium]